MSIIFLILLASSCAQTDVTKPEQKAIEATVGILCPECGDHAVATAVYVGKGKFLTALHCAPVIGSEVTLVINGEQVDSRTIKVSEKSHLALLRTGTQKNGSVSLSEKALTQGDPIFSIGYPKGIPRALFRGRVSKANWISGVQGFPEKLTVLDMNGAPGISGAGVYKLNGTLAGLIIATVDGIPLAVRIEEIKEFLE